MKKYIVFLGVAFLINAQAIFCQTEVNIDGMTTANAVVTAIHTALFADDEVMVTGTVSIDAEISLNIPEDKFVAWAAQLTGNTTGNLVNITGAGMFAVGMGGAITHNGTAGVAVYNAGTGDIYVVGGTVSATSGSAIINASTGVIYVRDFDPYQTLITTATANNTRGAIVLENNGTETYPRLIISGGTVQNTSTNANSNAIRNASTGAINVSGGTVSAGGNAIRNENTGVITISQEQGSTTLVQGTITLAGSQANSAARLIITGGTVQNTGSSATSHAVHNVSTGAVNVSGGTVSANLGRAISNDNTGVITISQGDGSPTLITSASWNATQGTITLSDTETNSAARLIITGGTVQNTATGVYIAEARTIYNGSTYGSVHLLGGTVSANSSGIAVLLAGASSVLFADAGVTITANTADRRLSATGDNAIAIERTGSQTEYTALTTGGLTVTPAVTAYWSNNVNGGGISYNRNNENIGFIPVNVTVNKLDPDMSGVTFANKEVTYDGTAHSIEYSGTLPDGVTFVEYQGNAQTDADEYTVTAIFAVSDGDNYNAPDPMTATLTINPIVVTVVPVPNQKVYGTPADPALTYTTDPPTLPTTWNPASVVLTRAPGDNAGYYPITIADDQSGDNYAVTLSSSVVNFQITPLPVTVTPAAQTKIYGAADPPLTYATTPAALPATWNTASVTLTHAGVNVGDYPIIIGADLSGDNYAVTLSGDAAHISITRAPLTLTANDEEIEFGDDAPTEYTYFLTGLVNNETAAVITTPPSFSLDRPFDNPAVSETFIIEPSGAAAANYDITYETGTLTIIACNHNMVEHITDAATCEDAGAGFHKCTKCDTEVPFTIAVLGHVFSLWETTTPATATTDGVETEKCSRCGALGSVTRPIPATGNVTNVPELPAENPLRAYVRNGLLHITGLTAGETISIYTSSGVLVHQTIATPEMDINLTTQGVYIIQSGENTVRVVVSL